MRNDQHNLTKNFTKLEHHANKMFVIRESRTKYNESGWTKHFVTILLLLPLMSFANCQLLRNDIKSSNNTQHSVKGSSINTIAINETNTLLSSVSVSSHNKTFGSDIKEFEGLMLDYIDDVLNRKMYQVMPGIFIKQSDTNNTQQEAKSFSNLHDDIQWTWNKLTNSNNLNVNVPKALQGTGRLFFFKGLKKLMWPLFIGLQVVKTILLMLFLPSIIGSVGKIVGKGLPSLSGTFSHPAETVDDLEFKDNSLNMDHEGAGGSNYNAYQYNIPEPTNQNFVSQMYDSAQANNALSRFGLGGNKVQYVNSGGDVNYRNNNAFATKKDEFKIFHDIPSSSLLLTNYDPFYSPLLSRLDAVFHQMGLGSSKDEMCREKFVCLIYANPAKYAPYSNLVSAQLSRELNELKKPTSENPDILRFFKYMRSAKDGQDGIDCEESYKQCSTFSDMSGPAMINTFNDINKLVQARKMH